MAEELARSIAAACATVFLLAPLAAGRGEYADRLATTKHGFESSSELCDAVRAGKIDREVLLADLCEAVRSDARFVDEVRRGLATNVLCHLTRKNAAGRLVIDHPLQLETLLLLSNDAYSTMRVNSLQALQRADGDAELVAKIEQRFLEAAQSDDSAMARICAAQSLGELVDRGDDAAWKKTWRVEFLRLAGDPTGDQVADYARVEAADPIRFQRDWQIDFRSAFLRSLALREGCRAVLTAVETYDVRGRIAALEGLGGAIVEGFRAPPGRQEAADLAAYVEWVALASSWIDVPRLPARDGGVDEVGQPILVPVEGEGAGAADRALISAINVLAMVARVPTCSEPLRERIASVIEQVGATGSERVHRRAERLREK